MNIQANKFENPIKNLSKFLLKAKNLDFENGKYEFNMFLKNINEMWNEYKIIFQEDMDTQEDLYDKIKKFNFKDEHNMLKFLIYNLFLQNELVSTPMESSSVEHVWPQEDKEWINNKDYSKVQYSKNKYINSLGNLIILPKKLNSQLSCKIFVKKWDDLWEKSEQLYLFNSEENYLKEFSFKSLGQKNVDINDNHYNDWNIKTITERSNSLIKKMKEQKFLINDLLLNKNSFFNN